MGATVVVEMDEGLGVRGVASDDAVSGEETYDVILLGSECCQPFDGLKSLGPVTLGGVVVVSRGDDGIDEERAYCARTHSAHETCRSVPKVVVSAPVFGWRRGKKSFEGRKVEGGDSSHDVPLLFHQRSCDGEPACRVRVRTDTELTEDALGHGSELKLLGVKQVFVPQSGFIVVSWMIGDERGLTDQHGFESDEVVGVFFQIDIREMLCHERHGIVVGVCTQITHQGVIKEGVITAVIRPLLKSHDLPPETVYGESVEDVVPLDFGDLSHLRGTAEGIRSDVHILEPVDECRRYLYEGSREDFSFGIGHLDICLHDDMKHHTVIAWILVVSVLYPIRSSEVYLHCSAPFESAEDNPRHLEVRPVTYILSSDLEDTHLLFAEEEGIEESVFPDIMQVLFGHGRLSVRLSVIAVVFLFEILTRIRVFACHQALRCTAEDEMPPILAPLGTQVDDVIGTLDDLHIVLDDEERMPFLQEGVESLHKHVHIVDVKPGGRFVKDEERLVPLDPCDVVSELDTLALSARE